MKEVVVNTFDQDSIVVVGGSPWTSTVYSGGRFNGYLSSPDQGNLDEVYFVRYFPKSGLYKVRFIYYTNSLSPKIDIGLDSNGANNLFSQVDTYTAALVTNVVKETTINITRGYHQVHFKVNGKNASSSSYQPYIQSLQFDLIAEASQYQEDQAPIPMPDGAFNRPRLQFATLSGATYTTTSSTAISTGVGVTVASPHTDKNLINMAALIKNGTINDGATIQIYRSTSSIPSQGNAPNSGDTSVFSATVTEAVAAGQVGIPACFVDSGLVPGQTYYYYITILSVTGGTTTIYGSSNQTTITAEPV